MPPKIYGKPQRPSRNPFDVVGDAAAGRYTPTKAPVRPRDAGTAFNSNQAALANRKRRAAQAGVPKVRRPKVVGSKPTIDGRRSGSKPTTDGRKPWSDERIFRSAVNDARRGR